MKNGMTTNAGACAVTRAPLRARILHGRSTKLGHAMGTSATLTHRTVVF